jgi:hypothetical protein
MDGVVAIRVPSGTTIYEGVAAGQGGGLVGGSNQIIIQGVKSMWVIQ